MHDLLEEDAKDVSQRGCPVISLREVTNSLCQDAMSSGMWHKKTLGH